MSGDKGVQYTRSGGLLLLPTISTLCTHFFSHGTQRCLESRGVGFKQCSRPTVGDKKQSDCNNLKKLSVGPEDEECLSGINPVLKYRGVKGGKRKEGMV